MKPSEPGEKGRKRKNQSPSPEEIKSRKKQAADQGTPGNPNDKNRNRKKRSKDQDYDLTKGIILHYRKLIILILLVGPRSGPTDTSKGRVAAAFPFIYP